MYTVSYFLLNENHETNSSGLMICTNVFLNDSHEGHLIKLGNKNKGFIISLKIC